MVKKNQSEDSEIGLEKALTSLESIVQELEKGNLGLDEGLKKFEQGVQLYRRCHKELEDAERKIKILTEGLKEVDYPTNS